MKKMNKKGFTLIELLAVIVILAIIMVIAIPQILKVIDSSRTSAWKDNVKMIERAKKFWQLAQKEIKKAANGKITVESIDISENPTFANTRTNKYR